MLGLSSAVVLAEDPPKAPAGAVTAAAAAEPQGGSAATPSSPLAIHVGDADLLIGGFMDLTAIMRSTATGNGIGTNFSAFPFTTTATGALNPTGNLSETRFSAQNSRITLQATSKIGRANVKGYLEADFLGNTAQNLNVTSNSDGLRLRLYWVQFTKGKFEFLAGQAGSLLMPNRNGLSPVPGDIFSSQDVDPNYQMGLTWGRTPEFRFIAHASDTVTAGVSIENPEQYTGGAVVLPAAFTAAEVDTGSGSSVVGSSSPIPNLYPDIIGKIAFDPKIGTRHQHIDAAVLMSGFKTFNPTTDTSSTATGTGGSVNAVIEPVKNIHLVGNAFFSNGGGRYIASTNAPDFIVNADQSVSLVKARSFIVGSEVQAGSTTLLYGYYSAAQFGQNVTVDTTGNAIGFGVPGSTSANRELHEATVGMSQTFFRDPKIGGMQLMVQYSSLQRTPFSVPSSTPADAKLNMVFVNVRYILP